MLISFGDAYTPNSFVNFASVSGLHISAILIDLLRTKVAREYQSLSRGGSAHAPEQREHAKFGGHVRQKVVHGDHGPVLVLADAAFETVEHVGKTGVFRGVVPAV